MSSSKKNADISLIPDTADVEDIPDFPPPPLLHRTMSHEDRGDELASRLFDQCREGETILSNFFTSLDGYTNFSFFRRENDEMVKHTLTESTPQFRERVWDRIIDVTY